MRDLSKKQIAAPQRRRLATMKKKCIEMATVWDGVDGYSEKSLLELAEAIQKVSDELVEEVD